MRCANMLSLHKCEVDAKYLGITHDVREMTQHFCSTREVLCGHSNEQVASSWPFMKPGAHLHCERRFPVGRRTLYAFVSRATRARCRFRAASWLSVVIGSKSARQISRSVRNLGILMGPPRRTIAWAGTGEARRRSRHPLQYQLRNPAGRRLLDSQHAMMVGFLDPVGR